MAKKYSLFAGLILLCLLVSSCSKDYTAQKPVYISIPDIEVQTNYLEKGTAHSKITSVWMYINGEHQGTYELPCTVPVLLPEGTADITLYPGINLNGTSSARAVYEAYEQINLQYTHTASATANADTFEIPDAQRITSYTETAEVIILENFDDAGTNFEKTPEGNAGVVEAPKSEAFTYPSEDNGKAGVLYTTNAKRLAEVASVKTYNLPAGGRNVYLELTYKCNQPFRVGVIANYGSSTPQKQVTAQVNTKESWNKIYVNLVTELTSLSGADNYKIFIGSQHATDQDTGWVYLDNLKLVY